MKWITSVGYTASDTPIEAVDVLKSLASASSSAADHSTATTQAGVTELCAAMRKFRLYGALQSLFKLHPLFDRAVAQILTADPSALIVLSRTGKQRVWEEKFRSRLVRSVTTHWAASCQDEASNGRCLSVETLLRRILFVNQMKHEHYNALLCTMDVTLDTFPFGGGVTLSDALHGCSPAVPFVTQGALQTVHQIGAGIASRLEKETTDNHPPSEAGASSSTVSNAAVDLKQLIDAYVHNAVVTATQSAVLRGDEPSTSEALNSAGQLTCDNVRHVLFRSSESVREWEVFLQSAYRMLQ
jgi:hypothetical protein